ncbi:Beta-lactamase-like protein [Kalmanozyma brasiliensis GHG001]|uniref:Metallo-beta-lactamase domain-containing protein n=1 Tax=Kalmanozyma brasiliensis (strain GHG001) TaxID=1365824 RepID=V5EQC6_KALBG|nr:Beta-lactamase-like protein [Kalmanozyma brasiliensis GHG001]EST05133.1 Beta-lactamase-like protein [Kalmanozyma brasiliensis GHG001]
MTAVELHKLNGDTSWLVRLPRSTRKHPDAHSSSHAAFYNLLLDPWLDPTPQIDGSPLFSRQTRIEPAAFASIVQLDRWLHTQGGQIDAILFSHPFSDHVHPQTVTDAESLAVLRRVMVFTTGDSLSALRGLKLGLDSEKVVNLSSYAFRQGTDQGEVLPEGIAIQHLKARDWAVSPAWNKLHGGILVSCSNGEQPVDILYSPHGVTPTSLPEELKEAGKGKRVLIHSFDRQTLPLIGIVACGFPNVLELIPAWRPDVVLATHDENKKGEGIVGRMLRREVFGLELAQRLVKDRYPEQSESCTLTQLAPGESIRIE